MTRCLVPLSFLLLTACGGGSGGGGGDDDDDDGGGGGAGGDRTFADETARYEARRREALAGCTLLLEVLGTESGVRYDAQGWVIEQFNTYEGELRTETLTSYERSGGRVVRSTADFHDYDVPGSDTVGTYGQDCSDVWETSSTVVDYDAAERPVSAVETGVDVCGETHERTAQFSYTVTDGLLVTADDLRDDGYRTVTTYDECGMPVRIETTFADGDTIESTIVNTYAGDCRIVSADYGGDILRYDDQERPVEYVSGLLGSLLYTYEGCAN